MRSTSRRRTAGRRAAQKLVRHRNIVRAAERLFSRNGYEPTAMEDVARAAGLAVGTIYNYFPSKTELLLAIVRRETDELYRRGAALLKNPPADPMPAMAALCDVIVDGFMRDDRGLLRELLAAAVNSPGTIGARLFEADLRLTSLLVRLIEKLKAEVRLDPNLDPIRGAGVLYAICMMWMTAYLMNDAMEAEQVRHEVRRGVEIASSGMLARSEVAKPGEPSERAKP